MHLRDVGFFCPTVHLLIIHTTFDGSPSKEKIGRFKHQTLKHAKRILRLFNDLFARVKKFHNMQKHLHEDMLRHGSSAHGLTLSFESKHQQSKRHTDQHSKKHAEVAAVGHERVVQSLRLNEGVKNPYIPQERLIITGESDNLLHLSAVDLRKIRDRKSTRLNSSH